MAEKTEFLQAIDDAILDADSLERFINGSEDETVLTRLSAEYPTLQKAIKELFENGAIAGRFETLAQLQTSPLADGDYALVADDADDKNGIYIKEDGAWVKSAYDPVSISNTYSKQVSNRVLEVQSNGQWLNTSGKEYLLSLQSDSSADLAVKAIKSVKLLNPVAGTQYWLSNIVKTTGTDSYITIRSPAGVVAQTAVASPVGLQLIQIRSMLNVDVEIDWDLLPSVFDFTADRPSDTQLYIATAADDFYLNKISKSSAAISANTLATTANTAAISDNTIKGNFTLQYALPDWLDTSKLTPSIINANNTSHLNMMYKAIKGVEIIGGSGSYRVSGLIRNHPTHGTRIFIAPSTSTTAVASYVSTAKDTSGVKTYTVSEVASSGVSASITIDWDEIENGLNLSLANREASIIKSGSVNTAKNDLTQGQIRAELSDIKADILNISSTSSGASSLPSKPYRVSIAGSSITWGGGLLGKDSYVGVVEQMLRNQYATTIHATDLKPTATELVGDDFYLSSARKITQADGVTEFSLMGDELSLSIARERGNMGACIVDLYVDNVLYDTFDTATSGVTNKTETFTGDGSKVKFNLATAHTYDHVVTVGGVVQKGSLNVLGSGATIPVADDYMIVRSYDAAKNAVVHTVFFKVAPTGEVKATYMQGENIRHMRGYADRVGAGFDSVLESAFGDGTTSYDETLPSALSSGLGFRESDERSVKTWTFGENKLRTYRLEIKQAHSAMTGATPYYVLNFVTNRMHHIQNAGIGGWDASELIDDSVKINTLDYVLAFNPDILLLESATNDDAKTGLSKAHIVRTGVTAQSLKDLTTSNYITAISGSGDNLTVNDTRVPIVEVTPFTIKLDSSVVDSAIAVGDAVIIGEYGGDHRRVQVRTVRAYDSASKVVTLNRSISADEFIQAESLADLVGKSAIFYSADSWKQSIRTIKEKLDLSLPDCEFYITTAGAPNYYTRKLFGYREFGQQVANELDIGFVDFYDATYRFLYNQKRTLNKTIVSTGVASYELMANGYLYHAPQVFVNGVEHKHFKVTGGMRRGWASSVSAPTMANRSSLRDPIVLRFDSDIPASGASITVYQAPNIWSFDYCHPSAPYGLHVLGSASSKILKDVK